MALFYTKTITEKITKIRYSKSQIPIQITEILYLRLYRIINQTTQCSQ
jgi:hypothetical protein